MAAIGTTGRDRRRTIQRLSQAPERASSCYGYGERRRARSYRPPHRKTVGPLAIRYTWIRPEISMTASTMLMMEVDEQTTDHKVTVPGSLAGGTRGSAQQAWGNRLETDPQQMQESRNIGQLAVSHIYRHTWRVKISLIKEFRDYGFHCVCTISYTILSSTWFLTSNFWFLHTLCMFDSR